MKKYFIAAVFSAILLTACVSDAEDTFDTASGTTSGALAELPSEITSMPAAPVPAPETTAAASEPVTETSVTAIFVPDDNYAEDTAVTSAGRIPQQTETAEIKTVVVHTSPSPQAELPPEEFTNPWETTAKTPEEAEKAANNEESSEFSARIISVDDNSISVEVLSEKWFDILGSFAQISTAHLESVPECSPGDYAEIIMGEEIGITEAYPLRLDEGVAEIKITKRLGIELPKNSVLAKVVTCHEVWTGEGYSLTIQAFGLWGYSFKTEISISSDNEFSVGDWVKVDFAEDTMFMESYPMQVAKQYVLGIEKV